MKHAQSVVRRLMLSEKGARLSETENKYFVEVAPNANKIDIKRAVEQLFKVKVVGVNTLNRMGKLKRDRRWRLSHAASWKRAVVTLKAGDKIDLT